MSGETQDADRFSTKSWPVEVKLQKAEKQLLVTYDSGETFTFPAEYLRVESPSAEVQGHSAAQKKTVPGRRHVGIMNLEPVGNYAVRIVFDDLHDSGIFSWQYLYELGADYEVRWANYLAALQSQGLSRDP